jgi:hypothetical protein
LWIIGGDVTDQPTENRNRTFALLLLGVLLLLTVALGVSAPSVYPEAVDARADREQLALRMLDNIQRRRPPTMFERP